METLLNELSRLRETTEGSHFIFYWSVRRKKWVGQIKCVRFSDVDPDKVITQLIRHIKRERQRIPKTIKYTMYN